MQAQSSIATTVALAGALAASPGAQAQEITTQRVTFPSEGETLVGTLYLPASHRQGARLPAVVVGGSWTTVKEQMAGLYAQRLAEQGFAALAFDHRYWGESMGEPRNYESPRAKIQDLRNAVTFLVQHPAVDANRIGGLAVCASAGYMAHAIAQDERIRSFATVSAWMHDPQTVGMIYEGAEGVGRRSQLGRAARTRFEQTGKAEYVPAYEPGNPNAGMFFPVDYYARSDRGAVPQWQNRFAVMSWPEWLEFDALAPAPKIRVPALFIHSDDAALPDNVRRFHAAMPGPKDLFWTQGQHIDFYDQEPYVSKAVNAAGQHFAATLTAR